MSADSSMRLARIPESSGLSVSAVNAAIREAASDADAVLLETTDAVDEASVAELLAVAGASPQHGIVVPAIVPAATRVSHEIVIPDRLPAVVRTSWLRLLGGLDESFTDVVPALADFALRANEIGVSTVVADRVGGASRVETSAADAELLADRNPRLAEYQELWDDTRITAQERFETLVVPGRPDGRRILLDLSTLDPIPNGTARSALGPLGFLAQRLRGSGFDVHLLASAAAAEYFDLERFALPVHDASEDLGVWDIAVALAPISSVEQADRLNRVALRWVAVHLDVIALRSFALRTLQPDRITTVLDALRFADKIVTISRGAARDLEALYGREGALDITAQHFGLDRTPLAKGEDELDLPALDDELRATIDAGGFLLVVGNHFPHKQVVPAVRALSGTGLPTIALTTLPDELQSAPGVFGLASGELSDALVERLYERAAAMVFPTAYEGFGLPLLEAAAGGLPIVAMRAEVGEEVAAAYELGESIAWFEDFDGLADAVRRALERGRSAPREVAGMDAFANAIADAVAELGEREATVTGELEARWAHYAGLRSAQAVKDVRFALLEQHVANVEQDRHEQSLARVSAERRAATLEQQLAAVDEALARRRAELEAARAENESLGQQLQQVTASRAYRAARAAGDLRARLAQRRG